MPLTVSVFIQCYMSCVCVSALCVICFFVSLYLFVCVCVSVSLYLSMWNREGLLDIPCNHLSFCLTLVY